MPTIKLSVTVDVDDIPITGFPLVRRIEFAEAQSFNVQRTTGAAFTALPTAEMTTVKALILQSDKTTAIRLNGVAGEVTLNPNSVVIVFDATMSTAPTLQNNSGSTATVVGLAAGQ